MRKFVGFLGGIFNDYFKNIFRLKFYRTTTRIAIASTAVALVGTILAPKLGFGNKSKEGAN